MPYDPRQFGVVVTSLGYWTRKLLDIELAYYRDGWPVATGKKRICGCRNG